MAQINYDSVKTQFLRITGLDPGDFEYDELIQSRIAFIEERLCAELNEASAKKCGYAACAAAVYDYVLENSMKLKVMLSENGAAYGETGSEECLRAAAELKNSAFSALTGLIRDDGFVFSGMEG